MTETQNGPIFVFASGQRCGSTLLQRFLISNPNIMVWGEHDGAVGQMMPHFDRLLEWERMFGHQFQTFLDKGYNNFIPNMNPHLGDTREAQRQLFLNLFKAPAQKLGRSIWGFKEVKYGADMALRLRDLFPEARIIHLTRNVFECFISLRHEEQILPKDQPHVPENQVWTRERTIEFVETWVKVNSSMLHNENLNSDWVYQLTYERLTGNKEDETARLAEWLGLEAGSFDLDVFKHKLYTDRHNGPDPRPPVKRSDLDEEEVGLVTTPEIMEISATLEFDMSII